MIAGFADSLRGVEMQALLSSAQSHVCCDFQGNVSQADLDDNDAAVLRETEPIDIFCSDSPNIISCSGVGVVALANVAVSAPNTRCILAKSTE
jgi:hypothetical protein